MLSTIGFFIFLALVKIIGTAALAVPAGVGLAIGFHMGKQLVSWREKNKVVKTLTEVEKEVLQGAVA